jgi:hypothetical protein
VQLPSAVACRVQTKFRRAALDFDILDILLGMVGASFGCVHCARGAEPSDALTHAFLRLISLTGSHRFFRADSKARQRTSFRDFDLSYFAPYVRSFSRCRPIRKRAINRANAAASRWPPFSSKRRERRLNREPDRDRFRSLKYFEDVIANEAAVCAFTARL